ncbi:MAG: hypothetical protein ACKOXF_06470 [Chitinophagaceae bacterium]
MILLCTTFYTKAQTLDKIRHTYFYSLPFHDSITYQKLVAEIDKNKDSFYLINQWRGVNWIGCQYVSLFTDSHFTTRMRIDVNGYCQNNTDTACNIYFLRLVPGSVVPHEKDSTKLDFRFGSHLTFKDKKRIFRTLNHSVYLRKTRLRRGWGREMIRYKEKSLKVGIYKFETYYDGSLHILLLNR